MDEYEVMEQMLRDGKNDWLKWKGGNKTAGTRVRKIMQDIKAQAQVIRAKVLESREAETKE